MIRLALNLRKPYNYAFFDPKSRIHLTVSSPVGFANEVTPAILRGLRSQVLIDVDGVVDAKTGMIAEKKDSGKSKPAKTDTPVLSQEPETEEPEKVAEVEEVAETPAEEPATDDVTEAETVPAETDADNEAQGKEEAKPKKKSSKKK